MKLIKLICPQCNAPPEVPAKVSRLSCSYCGMQLAVQHSGGAVQAEALGEITDELRAIRTQQDLLILDKEWERERDQFLVRGKDDTVSVPTVAGRAYGVAFGVVFAIVGASMLSMSGDFAPGLWSVGVLLMTALGSLFAVISGVQTIGKAKRYRIAKDKFEQRRRATLERLRTT